VVFHEKNFVQLYYDKPEAEFVINSGEDLPVTFYDLLEKSNNN
jgi:hypothetical protein